MIRLYGIGRETDAFVASQSIPQVITSIVVSALNSVWLPKLSANCANLKKWNFVLSKSLGQALFISAGFSLLMLPVLKPLVNITFPGFNEIQEQQAFYFVMMFIVSMNFTILSSQLANALRTLNQFYHVEMINFLGSVLVLPIIYFISPYYGLMAISLILMIQSVFVFIVQLKYSKWPSILVRRGLGDKESWQLMKPVFAGASIYKFSPLVDRFWLSFAPAGVMTVFNLAQNLVSAAAQVVEKSVVMSLTTNFGKLVKDQKFLLLKSKIRDGIIRVTIISILILVFALIFKVWLIQGFGLFFKTDNVNSEMIWFFCVLLIGYFHSSPAATIPVSALYAFKDTRTPVKTGIVGFLISIIFKAILYQVAGINGLVIGVSLYFLMNFLSHLFFLFKRNEFHTISN